MALSRRGTARQPPLHFLRTIPSEGPWVVFVLVQAAILLSAPRTGGITHWKLTDDTIAPGSMAPEVDVSDKVPISRAGGRSEDVFAAQLASSDPEFAILLRYSSKSSRKGISSNRGGGSHGTFRRVSEDMEADYCESGSDESVAVDLSSDTRSYLNEHCQATAERKETTLTGAVGSL